ncbi:MAG TPA: hypothetical protein PKA33_13350 [Amaricoccus sp.]|uniref:hypothetical protein n=1 Tax=Amaricoccus sp. TaxID=1872485 RepID=UPI002C155BF1|nr:hypothetical protein [Amaricoccus sp.]HMQ93896.1 hypothetical protein [Amaricoccus sp.]HMR51060.1 hypothetical protein [Amaricoccus sp.]HMR60000.1 hypothetical protein [Amaricoccus sp.]HMU00337.1 hypothetical protein [Amaricoccus sp.]
MPGKALRDHVSARGGPRQAWTAAWPPPGILLVVLRGTPAGAEDVVEIARWGRQGLGLPRTLLPSCRARPPHPRR